MNETIFYLALFALFYSYIGYGLISYIIVKIKKRKNSKFKISELPDYDSLPEVTVLVAAFNEEECIEEKIKNSLDLDYPEEKLNLLFVTDGSTDRTTEIISKYPKIKLLHQKERKGKVAAVNRAMKFVNSSITVFTDANALINKAAIMRMVRHYKNPQVGAVAGEKKVLMELHDNASSAGEGIYWKYESLLKTWDAEINTVVGAAGELFSVRTKCFEFVKEDTIIEDFFLTLRIAQSGYKVAYEPGAYAVETSSLSVKEELKRKIRISAGGFQAMVRLKSLLNIFKYKLLTFQYVSHRVLRWTVSPLALVLVLILNIYLLDEGPIYSVMLIGQVIFYVFAIAGFMFENFKIRIKAFFVPYYFLAMNYSVFVGFFRYLSGNQSVLWKRAERKRSRYTR